MRPNGALERGGGGEQANQAKMNADPIGVAQKKMTKGLIGGVVASPASTEWWSAEVSGGRARTEKK